MAGKKLDGWQEIADHLGKAVRTVQRWEHTKQLPVHRLAGDPRSRKKESNVYAFGDELQEWLEADGNLEGEDSSAADEPRAQQVPLAATRQFPGWLKAAALAAPVLAIAGFLLFQTPPGVTTASLVNNQLIAFSAEGQILWRKPFPYPVSMVLPNSDKHPWQVVDLDGDSQNEVLFAPTASIPSYQSEEILYCYDRSGEVRWSFSPGGILELDGHTYPDKYRLWSFGSYDLVPGGGLETVVVANHAGMTPSLTTILNSDGETIGQYWHTGYIFDHAAVDLDHDGIPEVVLAGVNSEFGKPCLAAIRPEIWGAVSPLPGRDVFPLKTGQEIAYLLFPRTDVADAMGVNSRVQRLEAYDNGHIRADVALVDGPDYIERTYVLDSSFRVVNLDLTAHFQRYHQRLEREGLLDHGFTPSEAVQIKGLGLLPPSDDSVSPAETLE